MKIHFFILFFVFASVIYGNEVKISYSKIGEKWREITSSFSKLPDPRFKTIQINKDFKELRKFSNIYKRTKLNIDTSDDFIEDFSSKISANQEIKDEMKNIFKEVNNVGNGEFINYEAIYNTGGKNIKYINVIIIPNKDTNKFEIQALDLDCKIEANEKFNIFNKSKGLLTFSEKPMRTINETAGIDNAEVELAIEFFRIIALSEMSQLYGFIFSLPESKE